MEGKAVRKLLHLHITIILFILLLVTFAHAQDFRSLWVGRLVMGQDKQGAAWMSGITANGQWPSRILYNWQAWPAAATDIGYHGVDVDNVGHHTGHGKDLVGQTSWWAGSRNWTSPSAGSWGPDGVEAIYRTGSYDIFVHDNGPVTLTSIIDTPVPDFIPVKHSRRVEMPNIKVDGADQQSIVFDPSGNSYQIDENLVSDGMLEAKWTHPMGLTFHDKWYAWTNADYEKIVIVETEITNSGDCNATIAGIEKDGQALEDLWIGVKHQIAGIQGFTDYGSWEQYNGEADWLLDYDVNNRYYWTWDGDAHDIEGDDQFDPPSLLRIIRPSRQPFATWPIRIISVPNRIKNLSTPGIG